MNRRRDHVEIVAGKGANFIAGRLGKSAGREMVLSDR